MSEPITVTNGTHEVKIYTVRNRGRYVHQLSYYEGGQRRRQTFADVADARREAKIVRVRLASTALAIPRLGTFEVRSNFLKPQCLRGLKFSNLFESLRMPDVRSPLPGETAPAPHLAFIRECRAQRMSNPRIAADAAPRGPSLDSTTGRGRAKTYALRFDPTLDSARSVLHP